MAIPPKYKSLVFDSPEDSPWVDQFRPQLESFMQDSVFAFDKGLTRAQNFASQKKVLTIQTGAVVADSFPLQFQCELNAPPESIRLGQVRTLAGTAPGAVDVSHWEYITGNTIKYARIQGLQINSKYELTLFIE